MLEYILDCPKRLYNNIVYKDQISCPVFCNSSCYCPNVDNCCVKCCTSCLCFVPLSLYYITKLLCCCDVSKYDFKKNLGNMDTELLLSSKKIITISKGDIPEGVKTIKFDKDVIVTIKYTKDKSVFPNSVNTMLNFVCDDDYKNIKMPPNLKKIEFFISKNAAYKQFQTLPEDFFPNGIKEILLAPNLILSDKLPESLEILDLRHYHNSISLGSDFYFPGDKLHGKYILENLQHLKIDYVSNYSFINNLPSNLKILEIDYLNYSLKNLPIGLEQLVIKYYNQEIHRQNYENSKIPFGCQVKIIDGTNNIDLFL